VEVNLDMDEHETNQGGTPAEEDERRSAQRVHLWVSGIVQGVFFRATTRDCARGLGLTGWVRNLPDGRVEVVAEGNQADLLQLVAFCRRGPTGAYVDRLEQLAEPWTGEFRDFTVRR
jgi:acylphosphatase